ncbi:MAG: U32 family peptidase [Chromatiales bacterium]|jgi:collagenase-like PrtC family protease
MRYPLKLSLGPILYYWPRQQVLDFYAEMLDLPLDIVYLGETVCAKRNQLHTDDWFELAERFRAAGKQVVISTLALLEAESELMRLRRICANERFLVEANDLGAIHLLEGRPFVAGHSVNIYNPRTLKLLSGLGLQRWVLPLELSAETLAAMQAERPAGVETEVFTYGRMPLAYSARCFTARAHRLNKDDCQYRCLDYPDGLTLTTQDDNRFLALNGIQTQSALSLNLLAELPRLHELSVDVLRISPQAHHTAKVVEIFAAALSGAEEPRQAAARLEALTPTGSCDGYWRGIAGMQATAQAAHRLGDS